MQAGRVPGQSDILVAWPAGNVLVSRPPDESGLKPSLSTTTAKASERVIADPPGWERERGPETSSDDQKPRGRFEAIVSPAYASGPTKGAYGGIYFKEGVTCLNKLFVELIWGAGV